MVIGTRHLSRSAVLFRNMRKMRALYACIMIPLTFLIIFNYIPMYGVVVAFKDFRSIDGILGSKWIGFEHFQFMFGDPMFKRAFLNTLRISCIRILVTFPLPIVFALLLNELKRVKFKRIVQTITYLPHFMSWIVISVIVEQLLAPDYGMFNEIIKLLGGRPVYFQSKKELFIVILLCAEIWQSLGWSAIIYLAAMSSIDPELYESAELDGANRLQCAIHITIPGIAPVVVIQAILAFSSLSVGGFDAVFNLMNDLVMDVADIIETYSYRKGILSGQISYGTTIGLFQNIISLIIVMVVNQIARRVSDYALW